MEDIDERESEDEQMAGGGLEDVSDLLGSDKLDGHSAPLRDNYRYIIIIQIISFST